jgi:tripeptidyl-peptidase-2
METNLEDSGPIYDCLTFHDGERWQAVVNTSEIDEQMQLCEPLSDYHVARQYQRFR